MTELEEKAKTKYMRGLSVKAILYGFALNWLLGFALGAGVALFVFFYIGESPATNLEARAAMMRGVVHGLPYLILTPTYTVVANVLSGMRTAWFAPQAKVKNAFCLSLLLVIANFALNQLFNRSITARGFTSSLFEVVLVTLGGATIAKFQQQTSA